MDKETQIEFENEIKQLRNELHSAHKFLDYLPDTVVLMNAEHVIKQVNREFTRLFGYSAEEVKGINAEILFPEKNNLLENLAKDNIVLPKQELRKKDKSSFWGEVHIKAYYDTQNQLKGYSILIKDVTEQLSYREELEFQSLLLDKIHDAITATDLQGNIIYVNEAECRGFNKSRSELLSMNVKDYGEDIQHGVSQQEIIESTFRDGFWRGKAVNFNDQGKRILYDTRTQLIYDQSGNPVSMVGVSTDITEREDSMKILAENEEFFRTIFTHSPVGMTQLTQDGKHIKCNELYCEMTGYEMAEMLNKNFQDITWCDDVRMEQSLIETVQEENAEKLNYEKRIERKDGRLIWVHVYANIVRGKDRNAKYVLVSLVDITRQRENSERLLNLSTRLTLAAESAEIGIWDYDLVKKVLHWDERMLQIYGVKRSEFVGNILFWQQRLHLEDCDRINDEIQKAIAGEKDFDAMFKIVWPDNSIHYLKVFAITERDQGKPVRMTGITFDVTAASKAEQKIKSALAEKNTLLRELYHRTKNNMQVISSMLDLEALSNDDENVCRTFQEMGSRIQAMSMVHHKLYQSQNLSQIDLGNYLEELSELLLKGNYPRGKKINIKTEMEFIEVQIDTAIPCGLIINELISNSLKYAFKNQSEGEITIKLFREDNLIHLVYLDNGCGFPKDFDFDRDINLGLLLVKKLSNNQLNGETRFDLEVGFGYETRFDDEYYKGN